MSAIPPRRRCRAPLHALYHLLAPWGVWVNIEPSALDSAFAFSFASFAVAVMRGCSFLSCFCGCSGCGLCSSFPCCCFRCCFCCCFISFVFFCYLFQQSEILLLSGNADIFAAASAAAASVFSSFATLPLQQNILSSAR